MKAVTIAISLTVLATLASKYGVDPLSHPVACVFAGFYILVLAHVVLR